MRIPRLSRCFAPERRSLSCFAGKMPPSSTQRIVRLETGACASLSRVARLRERERREHLCRCQSASLWQPKAHEGEHRIGPPSLPRHRHGRGCPARCAPGVGCGACPTSILSTSPGKYQVLWRVEGFDFARQEQTLKLLAIAFGGDPACTDCNRVLRVPGFLNRKYDPAHPVTVEYPGDSVWTPERLSARRMAQSDAMLFAALSPDSEGSRKAQHIPRAIGHGFLTSLLTAKMPRS